MTSPNSSQSTEPRMQINLRAAAQLFKLDVQDQFNAWNADKPLRTGFPHASNILAPESEFCLRKLVLMACFPDEAERPALKKWNTIENMRFKNGWALHEKYQKLLERYGEVIYTNGEPELDRTHFDETRLIYWSPDAIVNRYGEPYVVEIKGYKQETCEKLDEMGSAPTDAHNQANLYMHLLELKHAFILVENKNTQVPYVWCVKYDREMVQPYLDRMYKFKASYLGVKAGRKSPPARKCEKSTDRLAEKCEMCRFCFFGLKDNQEEK